MSVAQEQDISCVPMEPSHSPQDGCNNPSTPDMKRVIDCQPKAAGEGERGTELMSISAAQKQVVMQRLSAAAHLCEVAILAASIPYGNQVGDSRLLKCLHS